MKLIEFTGNNDQKVAINKDHITFFYQDISNNNYTMIVSNGDKILVKSTYEEVFKKLHPRPSYHIG